MRLALFRRYSVVSARDVRTLITNTIYSLIESNSAGLRVDMNSPAQKIIPNLPAALAHKLVALVSAETTREELDQLYHSLELNETTTASLRSTLCIALAMLPRRNAYNELYRAIRVAVDSMDQIRIHTTSEEGHVCRVTTYWQDEAAREASEAASTK